MKNKWLIILFALFLGIIFISLLLTQQNNNIAPLLREKIPTIAQPLGYPQPLSSPISRTSLPVPLAKSGITVIKPPSREPENKTPPAQVKENIETTATENSSSNTEGQSDTQAGITIIGKHPTPKEAKEMNSAGIVMY